MTFKVISQSNKDTSVSSDVTFYTNTRKVMLFTNVELKFPYITH